ncbi:hypothetical protein LCGC14_1616120 [marine sediment metagenome]|uniref:Uncharacterized protein n=1 Tax=marine sediment metagenome TaxID=412755 RepID=A0A0F9I6U9_9ZZZZ
MKELTLHSSSGRDFGYRVGEAGEVQHVTDPTAEQLELLREYMELSIQLDPDDDHNIHRVWHDFCERFMDYAWNNFKMRGCEMLDAVREWARQYPDDVVRVRVDDGAHCGSELICIMHKCRYKFMGMSVVLIPQCTGEPPTQFFLYPDHVEGLLDVLTRFRTEELRDRSGSPVRARGRELEAQLLATVAKEGD